MKNKPIFAGIFLILLGSITLLIPVAASSPLHFSYSQSQDNLTKDYVFTITFRGNDTIYGVNLTLTQTNQQYALTPSTIQPHAYYLTIPYSLQQRQVTLAVASSQGYSTHTFTIQLGIPKQTLLNDQLHNTILGILGLVLLLGLLAKYVLWYEEKKQES